MVFHWGLNYKSSQVSRTLLSILADLNNAAVWMVFTHPTISKSISPYTNPLVTVPRAPITFGIIVTFMFHNLFNSQARSRYLSLLPGQQSPQFCKFSFFLLIMIRSGRLAKIWWSVRISKSQRSLCVSFFRIHSGLCISHLLVWSNIKFLPTQSCIAIIIIMNIII